MSFKYRFICEISNPRKFVSKKRKDTEIRVKKRDYTHENLCELTNDMSLWQLLGYWDKHTRISVASVSLFHSDNISPYQEIKPSFSLFSFSLKFDKCWDVDGISESVFRYVLWPRFSYSHHLYYKYLCIISLKLQLWMKKRKLEKMGEIKARLVSFLIL